MNGQLSFDDVRPHVGTTRRVRRATERQLLDRMWRLAAAARRCRTCPPDVLEAVAALDDLGDVAFGGPVDNGTVTSARAAAMSAPAAGTLRYKVLDEVRRASDGLTDDEIEQRVGGRHESVSARRRELVLGGLLVADGIRPTRRGADATVWRAVNPTVN